MKYIVMCFCIGFTLLTANAGSVIIQPRFNNSFRFAATDVWNIDLQTQIGKGVNVYLNAEITQGGKGIVSLKSSNTLINSGVQSFTSVSLNTSQLIYKSQAIADIENLTGTFPAGNYQVCYTIHCVTADCDGLGADAIYNETSQCFEFIIEPPTPLLLASPEDKVELEWPRPTFNWIPPMPLSSVNGFNYLYTLTEKQEGQTCNDAIIRNRPLYKQRGVEIPMLPFPPEMNDLDTGKIYCWKVEGLVDQIPVAQSEVWEFHLKTDTIPVKHRIMLWPSRSINNTSYLIEFGDTLVFSITEEFATENSSLVCKIRDLNNHENVDSELPLPLLDYISSKHHYFIIGESNVYKAGNTYQFMLVSATGDTWYINLKVKNEKK
ncbi:MAG: hypothetical protein KG003_09445 [Bacteroidetes bacterium]|nr:hypothetical protein [Bacteroidota bacterium]